MTVSSDRVVKQILENLNYKVLYIDDQPHTLNIYVPCIITPWEVIKLLKWPACLAKYMPKLFSWIFVVQHIFRYYWINKSSFITLVRTEKRSGCFSRLYKKTNVIIGVLNTRRFQGVNELLSVSELRETLCNENCLIYFSKLPHFIPDKGQRHVFQIHIYLSSQFIIQLFPQQGWTVADTGMTSSFDVSCISDIATTMYRYTTLSW